VRLTAASLALLAACGSEGAAMPVLPGLPLIAEASYACPAPDRAGCYLPDAERATLRYRVGRLRRDMHRSLLRVAEERRGSMWRQRRILIAATVALVTVRSLAVDRVDLRSLDDDALANAEGRYMVLDEAAFRARFDALGAQ